MSVSPFRKPAPDDAERRQRWNCFFEDVPRRAEQEAEEVIQRAKEFDKWYGMPYTRHFLRFLEDESHKPCKDTDHMSLLTASTRANTFREILGHLEDLRKRASIALEETYD